MNKNLKRVRTVKEAKSVLRLEQYTFVKWDKKHKSFLVQTKCGQRKRIFYVYK